MSRFESRLRQLEAPSGPTSVSALQVNQVIRQLFVKLDVDPSMAPTVTKPLAIRDIEAARKSVHQKLFGPLEQHEK